MTDPIRAALERLVATSDVRNHDWHAALATARTALSAPKRAEGVGELALELGDMAEAAAHDSRFGDAHFLSRAAAVIQNQQAEVKQLKAQQPPAPAPVVVPVPEGPTDEELLEAFDGEFAEFFDSSDGFGTTAISRSEWTKVARAVLARWGRAPAPVPVPEPGEVGELVAELNRIAADARAAWQITDARALTRAATLLQQQAAPSPAVAPVPVSERLPGPGEWVWHCYAGVRFWQHGRYNGRQFFIGNGPESQPATHWLPANALPAPEATND